MIEDTIDMKVSALLERILLVDENAELAEATKLELTSRGFKVTVARDGGQAHGNIRMNRPDLVLMQALLPGESGFEICEKMKQQFDTLPIIMLTEINLDSARNLAQRVGADGYLVRPYDTDVLTQMMRQVADAVAQRTRDESMAAKKETGTIRYFCRCGKRLKERYENRGKHVTCPDCQARVQVPNKSLQEFFTHQSESQDDSSNIDLEPLKFVTIKCQHCATFYRLTGAGMDLRKCPRCGREQVGSLSIVGAPMSRAALESSLRVLRVLNGKSKGKKLLLPEMVVTFGQAPDCAIRHGSKSVSAHHCRLLPTKRGVLVTDLASDHGTFINEERLEPHQETLLGAGSVLQIGELQFRLIGEETSIAQDMSRVQTWSAAQDDAKEKGINLIEAGKETAAEAAQVIQQYWNIKRKRGRDE